MQWLSDEALSRLKDTRPDFSGTRYRLERAIGSGGMGSVFLAEDLVLHRRVALKVLRAEDAGGDLAERMLREAHILAALEHPGIVPVHDAGTLPDGRVFYTMKYVEGKRLDRLAAERMSASDSLRLFQRICEAVAFAHVRGVIHRDLKPQNIMVGPFGEVLVMDWGIAKILRAKNTISLEAESSKLSTSPERNPIAQDFADTAHGTVMGTLGYMAPEQERGEVGSVDERSDIYALGAILLFLLKQSRDNHLPRPLVSICTKAMAAEPSLRYATAQELMADVGAFMDGRPVSAHPETLLERAGRVVMKHQVWVMLLLTYLVVRMILLLWLHR